MHDSNGVDGLVKIFGKGTPCDRVDARLNLLPASETRDDGMNPRFREGPPEGEPSRSDAGAFLNIEKCCIGMLKARGCAYIEHFVSELDRHLL